MKAKAAPAAVGALPCVANTSVGSSDAMGSASEHAESTPSSKKGPGRPTKVVDFTTKNSEAESAAKQILQPQQLRLEEFKQTTSLQPFTPQTFKVSVKKRVKELVACTSASLCRELEERGCTFLIYNVKLKS